VERCISVKKLMERGSPVGVTNKKLYQEQDLMKETLA
jgi:hypothetical protein